MDPLPLLHRCQLCAGMNEEELCKLARIAAFRRLAAGETLFQEGDPGTGFFVLLQGRVRVYKASPEGKEYTLHLIQPGMMFAEVAIFTGHPYPASCLAMEDALVAFFPREAFLAFLRAEPQVSMKIIASLAGFVREFNRQVEALSLKEVPARLAAWLLAEAERQGADRLVLTIFKGELAAQLGTVGETLSRNLRKFKEAGLIRLEGKAITIVRPEELADIANGIGRL
ncbi:MAG TPA: Crp/Fnr family transcriptional regulator [Acidobacteriota bacterium]|nr:Crp/Fnr family transcriptional regulator [Acidobacteriota bacterium]HQF87931.1 Crp/Fnr family transcriptional regulator [Acidobacteriota bacterium]HQG92259.1 Crp/Fnr family transcriptional regulator [Acidobacteriota bacterium]HQK88080.1 Crp/Fnr family transcriptional regulator [Acidobacteriota bacterium]